jgi:hypothetical protein
MGVRIVFITLCNNMLQIRNVVREYLLFDKVYLTSNVLANLCERGVCVLPCILYDRNETDIIDPALSFDD